MSALTRTLDLSSSASGVFLGQRGATRVPDSAGGVWERPQGLRALNAKLKCMSASEFLLGTVGL